MLNYNPQGLIPAIIQDDETNAVLMLGYMSPETLQRTKDKGQCVFWSRSRQEVWHKGATSGDYLECGASRRLREQLPPRPCEDARQSRLPHRRPNPASSTSPNPRRDAACCAPLAVRLPRLTPMLR